MVVDFVQREERERVGAPRDDAGADEDRERIADDAHGRIEAQAEPGNEHLNQLLREAKDILAAASSAEAAGS